MNNSVIDVAFIAAKVAAIKDEKARMIVGGASFMYLHLLPIILVIHKTAFSKIMMVKLSAAPTQSTVSSHPISSLAQVLLVLPTALIG